MNLNVPDLRKRLRRRKKKPDNAENTPLERRKATDRRANKTETTSMKNGKRILLTPKQRKLLQDMFFLDEKDTNLK